MEHLSQLLLIGVVLSSLYILGSAMLSSCIRMAALQGVALGLLPITLYRHELSLHLLLIAAGMIAIKGFLIPHFLYRAIRDAALRKEVEPLISFNVSIVLGMALVAFGFGFSAKLPLPADIPSPLLVPVALSTLMMGLLVIISRVKLITQAVGYLVLENGIFIFGLTLSEAMPELIEMGVLLDVFVGVFVMGVVIYHINQMFGSLSSHKLSTLKE